MKKIIITLLLSALALITLGCNAKLSAQDVEPSIDPTVTTEENFYISPTDDIEVGNAIATGDIIGFFDKTIHIMCGDVIEVFEYDNSNAKAFYIGQTVQLIKGQDYNYLAAFTKEDYTIAHTNMGHVIEQISGTVTTSTEQSITVESATSTITIKCYEPTTAIVGDFVTAYYMTTGDDYSSIITLNEKNKLSLQVTDITRDNNGAMILSLEDVDEALYTIDLSYELLEFDMATLSIGDILTVYHDGIMESWPMQINTILIRK